MTARESLGPAIPRWWRHPAALGALHVQAAMFGVLAAAPLATQVADAVGSFGGVDATAFDGGGVLLGELLRVLSPGARSLAFTSAAVLIVSLAFGLVATAVLLGAMAEGTAIAFAPRCRKALSSLPSLVGLLALATSAKLVLVAALWTLAKHLLALLAPGYPDRDVATCVAIVAIAALVSIVSVLQDLARAALAGAGLGFFASLAKAAEALRARPVALFAGFALRALTSWMLLLSAVLLTFRIGMREATSAWMSLALLEAALVAATCLRASWLGLALTAVLPRDPGTALPDDDDSSRKSPSAPR